MGIHPDFRLMTNRIASNDFWFAWIYVYGRVELRLVDNFPLSLFFCGQGGGPFPLSDITSNEIFLFWQVEIVFFCVSAFILMGCMCVAIEICVTRHKTSIVPNGMGRSLLIYVGAIKTSSHFARGFGDTELGKLYTLQWEIRCNLAHVFS